MSIESNKIYKIIGKNDFNAVIDVESQSTSQDANLIVNTFDNSNSQKIMPILDADDYYKYKMLGSNLYMMIHTGAAAPGAIVKQYGDTGADIFKWKTELFTGSGSKALINGVEYDTYNIKHKPDESLQLDYITDITEADKHLKVQVADADSEGQRFAFLPDSLFNNTLPAPTSSFSGYYLLPKLTEQLIEYNTRATGYDNFQIRVRKRGLIHNTNTFGDWGDWESPDESKQDNGWGDAWTYNASGDTQLQKVIVNEDPYDAYQYQMETRVFAESGGNPTHGNTTITTLLTVPQLELLDVGLNNVVIGASGIIFEFDFDYDREVGKEIEITRVYNKTKDREVFEGLKTFTLSPNQRSVMLSFEELRSLPDLEDDVQVKMTYKMLDGTLPTQSITRDQVKKVSYDGGTLVPEIELVPINEYDYYVKILNTDITSSDISLLYNHDGKVNVGKLSKKDEWNYKLAAPVGTQFRLYVYIENATEWGAKVFTFDFGKKLAIVFNTYTSEVAFTYFPNGWQDFKIEKDNGFETLKLEGRNYEKVFYSTVKGSKISLDAWFLNTERQKIEMALNDGFALLRTPQEYYSVVAITGIQYEPGDEKLTRVKIDMQEVDNEVDFSIPG